ncbi:MAG: hypothetical protein LBR65_03940 [Culturomica sp.]|jgi:phage protein D|nr:hypothetical protein [Culturomica sp.]
MKGLKPVVIIRYADKNVTSDFAPILTGVSFRDYLEGRASSIELQLSNAKGFFFGDWYPEVADKISLRIGYEGLEMMDCGTFWVDEIKLTGGRGGDECTISAMSIKPGALHGPKKRIHHPIGELKDFAGKVAAELELKVAGDMAGTWGGFQKDETDIELCYRIAKETGCVLKVEGDTLVFTGLYAIQKQKEEPEKVLEIPRGNVLSYDVSNKAAGRITGCTVKWRDVKTKKEYSGSYDAGLPGGGSALIWEEVDSDSAAAQKAKDYVTDRNKKGEEFSMSLMGDVRLRAGICVRLKGFGRFDKSYYIAEATHSISSSGYTTNITLRV